MDSIDLKYYYDIILDATYDSIAIIDVKSKLIVYANKSMSDMLGLLKDQIIGNSVFDFLDSQYKQEYIMMFDSCLKNRKGVTEVIYFTDNDLNKIPVEPSFKLIEHNDKIYMIVSFRNVKDRLQVESLLKRQNRLYNVLSNINHLIVKIKDKNVLFDKICETLVEEGRFKLAWVGFIENDNIVPKFFKGDARYLENIYVSTQNDTIYGTGPSGISIREKRIVISNNIEIDKSMIPWIEKAKASKFKSSCTLPIIPNGNPIAVLKIYSDEINFFDSSEEALLSEIALNINHSIEFLQNQEKILNLSSMYQTLSDVNQIIVRIEDEENLFKKICRAMVEKGLFKLAWIGILDEDKKIDSIYSYPNNDYVKYIKEFLDRQNNQGPTQRSITMSKIFINNNTALNSYMLPWRNELMKRGLLSSASIPIIKQGKTIGSLNIYSDRESFFNKEIFRLLHEIQLDISYALNKIKSEQEKLIISEALKISTDLVVITDKNGDIIYVNDAVEKVTGYKKTELIGKNPRIFKSGLYDDGFYKSLWDTITSKHVFNSIVVNRKKDHDFCYIDQTIIPVDVNGKTEYFVSVGKNVSKDEELQNKIYKLFFFDPITNLPNRKKLVEYMDEFLDNNRETVNCLVIMDPVGFSTINEVFGYYVGDNVLREIASRLKHILPEHSFASRLDSDRFGIFIYKLKDDIEVLELLVKLKQKLTEIMHSNNEEIKISSLFGISFYPDDAKDAEGLIIKAAMALSNAKSKKISNEFSFFKKGFDVESKKEILLKNDLYKAFEKKEFILYYQPCFNVKTSAIEGAEALIRWKKNDSIIPPSKFMFLLERMEFMTNIDEWIVDEVCSKLNMWRTKGFRLVPISINISPNSFNNTHIADNVIAKAREHVIDPSFLRIEFVERTFIHNIMYARSVLNTLKEYNIGLSIDDFGTGYSSLSYLASLPFDVIKIDISFIRKIVYDKRARVIVKIILTMAKDLGMKCVAEGVETKEQLRILERMDCDYVQGYLFSKPLDEKVFESFIADM